MDSNGFYYTLSTISQTLAGAFGFLVAVFLYRMQAIKDNLFILEREADEKRHHYLMSTSLAIGSIEQRQAEKEKAEKAVKDARDRLESMKGELRVSLKFTAVTIVACFVALPWVNPLTRGWLYYPSCLGLLGVVVLAVYCVRTYLPLVRSLTE